MGKIKPRYEVRTYLGKYEHWLLVVRTSGAMRKADQVLERFFATFPEKTGLEHFNSVDIADYKAIRVSQGAKPLVLELELREIKKFWTWLRADMGLPVTQIKNAFSFTRTQRVAQIRPKITLEEVKKLLAECPDGATRRAALQIVSGGKVRKNKKTAVLKEAMKRAGLGQFTLGDLKLKLNKGLGRDIVQAYCKNLGRTFKLEPEFSSNSLATVKVPTTDERPPVSYSGYELLPGICVNQEELRTEGQSSMSYSVGHPVEA